MRSANSASLAPLRSGSRKSIPRPAYKHMNHVPSAVIRLRSQERQNGAVVDATIPNVVPSARRKRSAGALGSRPSVTGVMAPYRCDNTARISRRENTCSGDHAVAPPTSMYSMNRTSASCARANSMRSTSSSSFTPRMTTVLILSRSKPVARAATMPARTSACRSVRAISRIRSGRRVSRLTVMRPRPALRNSTACFASKRPFVVIARSRTPGTAASIRVSAGKSCRSNGSPPVRRTLSAPSEVKTPTSRVISSNVRMDCLGSHT